MIHTEKQHANNNRARVKPGLTPGFSYIAGLSCFILQELIIYTGTAIFGGRRSQRVLLLK